MVIVWPFVLVNTAHSSFGVLLFLLIAQGHPSNLHHIMATNVQMSIIRSSAPGPPLHIGASHLPRGKAVAALSLPSAHSRSGEVHRAFASKILQLMQPTLRLSKLLAQLGDCWPFKHDIAFSRSGQGCVTAFKVLADTSTSVSLILSC